MPAFTFKPIIRHGQRDTLAYSRYGIVPPRGLGQHDIRVPTYITPTEMVAKLRPLATQSAGLGVVHGLTVPDVSISFSNLSQQWLQRDEGRGRRLWVFQGGDILLNLDLNVFVLQGERPVPRDRASERIFALIIGHELEHVADEIDIIRTWLPEQLAGVSFIRRDLSEGAPVDEGTFRRWYAGLELQNFVRNSLWAAEHNRRGALRDTPTHYSSLSAAINDIRAAATNRP